MKPSKVILVRTVTCKTCVAAGEEVLGRSFSTKKCDRCKQALPNEIGFVVEVPLNPLKAKSA